MVQLVSRGGPRILQNQVGAHLLQICTEVLPHLLCCIYTSAFGSHIDALHANYYSSNQSSTIQKSSGKMCSIDIHVLSNLLLSKLGVKMRTDVIRKCMLTPPCFTNAFNLGALHQQVRVSCGATSLPAALLALLSSKKLDYLGEVMHVIAIIAKATCSLIDRGR